MTRAQALRAIIADVVDNWGRVDQGTRIYIENRVSRQAFLEAVGHGQRLVAVNRALKHLARPHDGLGLVVHPGSGGITRETLEFAERLGFVRRFASGWLLTDAGHKAGLALNGESAKKPTAVTPTF